MVHVYGMEASASVLLGTARLPPVPGGTGGGEEQLRGTLREMVLEDPGAPWTAPWLAPRKAQPRTFAIRAFTVTINCIRLPADRRAPHHRRRLQASAPLNAQQTWSVDAYLEMTDGVSDATKAVPMVRRVPPSRPPRRNRSDRTRLPAAAYRLPGGEHGRSHQAPFSRRTDYRTTGPGSLADRVRASLISW